MTQLHFLSIRGKTLDIIDAILHTGEVVSVEFMLDKIHLVVEEVVTNIVKYAYPDGADGYLDVEAENCDGQIILRFRDGGTPFNRRPRHLIADGLSPDRRLGHLPRQEECGFCRL